MLSVSVVIPVYNQADLIGRAIKAVCEGSRPPLEIIVVDDGSTDGVRQAVEAAGSNYSVQVRLLTVPHGGPGRARDAGWRSARGDLVAFTDADAVPEPDWIRSAVEAFSHDQVGAVEGKVVADGVPTIFTHQVKNLSGGRFMTANMFYRRSVIDEVGGFKSRYREDSDLAFSVIEHGYEILFVPESVVIHPPREEGWDFYFEKANRKRFEALLFRNHPEVAPRYLPRFQPTELLVLGGELFVVLALVFGVWSVVFGLTMLTLGLPKRIAAWLDGRTYSGRDYLLVWVLTLALVPVEAYYHWLGVLKPPR
ncbi:MAG: glycosyltransferase family A protein [Thermaerobacter sp.]|nr:glycosyltransferase family A protein [Thermaerobacter sp.]